MNSDLEKKIDNLKAEKELLEDKIRKFREMQGGGGQAVNVLNLLDFPKDKNVGTFEKYMTEEIRLWNKEVHHRE